MRKKLLAILSWLLPAQKQAMPDLRLYIASSDPNSVCHTALVSEFERRGVVIVSEETQATHTLAYFTSAKTLEFPYTGSILLTVNRTTDKEEVVRLQFHNTKIQDSEQFAFTVAFVTIFKIYIGK